MQTLCGTVKMIKLKYGNTNTFLISGSGGNLLIDTDYAGTLPAFYQSIKGNHVKVSDVTYVLATHYHPDHIGLVSELMKQGVRLLLLDVQAGHVHDSDYVFQRERHLQYEPIDEGKAVRISCGESRDFLGRMGIAGEIVSTPSHSEDSISVVLDNGDCFVGDLEPMEHLGAYEDNVKLEKDWERLLRHGPRAIYYAHR